MTFDDMMVVEAHVADLHAGVLPVMLSKDYDRVDVDARKLDSATACNLADALAQSLGRKGCLWDVWMAMNDHMIHVAERRREAEPDGMRSDTQGKEER